MKNLVVGLTLFSIFCTSMSHLDELQFTCRSHGGCEIFEYCTKSAISELREQVGDLVNEKLKETNESWRQEIENVQRQSEEKAAKDLQELRAGMESEIEKKMTDVNAKMNRSIYAVRKSMTQRTFNDRKNLDDSIDAKVQESVRRMTFPLRKAQGEMEAANKKAVEELKTDTQKLVTTKVTEASRRWNLALGKAKNDLTTTINKAMAITNRRIKLLEDKMNEASATCNDSIAKMNNVMQSRLEDIAKGKIKLNEVEQMIDAKVKQASLDWTMYMDDDDDFFSGEEDTSHDVSVTRRGPCKVAYDGKCFWVVEPEMAVPYENGVKECQQHGGEIANVYSKAHMDLLTLYMRSLIYEKRMYIDAWTGMKIDPMSEDLTYTNGSKLTFFEWEEGSPAVGRSFQSWTAIYIVVKKDPKSEHQGMVNSSPESIRDGVLCEL